ncbi:MAG: hypothetical protein ACREUU_20475, partial [Gammaproteobacteria bacterium]
PSGRESLMRVPASGGATAAATTLGAAEMSHRFPQFLTDSRHFVYFIQSGRPETRGVYAGSLDDPGRKTRLIHSDSNAIYSPALNGHPGYLLWVRQQTLLAQQLNERSLRLEGEPSPVDEGIGLNRSFNLAEISASASGTLVYNGGGGRRRIEWINRSGTVIGAAAEEADYYGVRISPDGSRAAVSRVEGPSNQDLWLLDLRRGQRTHYTFEPGSEIDVVWSPDSRQVVFSSAREGPYRLFRRDSMGSGQAEQLTTTGNLQRAHDWSRDGQVLLYSDVSPQTGTDLWLLSMAGKHTPVAFLTTPFNEADGQFRPVAGDRRWIAYSSDESGRDEIFVRRFPDSGAKWQVSSDGGSYPRWRADGNEIFFMSADGKLMAAGVRDRDGALDLDSPRALFPIFPQGLPHPYDVAPDGRRFLVLTPAEDGRSQDLTVVLNWQAALRK